MFSHILSYKLKVVILRDVYSRSKTFLREASNMTNQVLKEIYLKSVESVAPQNLVRSEVKLQDRHLVVRGQTYPLHKPCYVVGFGKAVLGMATEIEKVLGNELERGIVCVPEGIFDNYQNVTGSKIHYIEGAKYNLPDENALKGANMIRELVEGLTQEDLLIVLISGGGSALLPLPIPPIVLEEKQNIIKQLAKRGADIHELNCVRKRISIMKGGGLAELAYPCRVVSLVLSDIIGDPLDFIASGPTIPNSDSAESASSVLKKYHLYEEIPHSIKTVLQKENRFPWPAGIPISNGAFEHVKTFIIGNNRIAAEAAKQEALNKGFQSAIVSTEIEGDVKEIAKIYAQLACNIASVISDSSNKDNLKVFLGTFAEDLRAERAFIGELLDIDYSRGICLIFTGEPTVVVTGNGKGGRNQQLALAFFVEVNKLRIKSVDISFLSCGTDGIDGPTDAAGAIATFDSLENTQNINPELHLENNDAYGFYETYNGGRNLIKIGHTGTNVMDIHIMIIKQKLS